MNVALGNGVVMMILSIVGASLMVTMAAIGVGALRVRLVATTDTLEYCLGGNVAHECR